MLNPTCAGIWAEVGWPLVQPPTPIGATELCTGILLTLHSARHCIDSAGGAGGLLLQRLVIPLRFSALLGETGWL